MTSNQSVGNTRVNFAAELGSEPHDLWRRFAIAEIWDLPGEGRAREVTQQSQDLHIGRVLSPAELQFRWRGVRAVVHIREECDENRRRQCVSSAHNTKPLQP